MPDEHDSPIRWRRWLGWGLAILVLLFFSGHAIWTSIAASRMAKKIDAIRRLGEPILPADFAVSNVNAPDNAGLDILAAARLIDPKLPEWAKYEEGAMDLPLDDEDRQILLALTGAIAPALKRLEAARGKTRFEWDIDFTQSMVGVALPSLSELRQLARALVAQAIHDHDRHLDRAALDRLEQTLTISRFADRHPSLVGHLVGIGIENLASSWIVKITPDLRIGPGPNEATPEQVRRIINRLMDDESAKQALMWSLRGERMFEVDMVNSMVNGVPMPAAFGIPGAGWHPAARYLIRPVYFRTGSQMIEHMNTVLLAANEKSWPAAKAKLPRYVPTGSILNSFTDRLIPALDRAVENHYRGMTKHHFAAVALAARWYAAEHNGELPPTLQDLVPTYLPSVPVDPFTADLKPLGYKSTPDAPIVYSVGLNGKDDGGSEAPSNPNPRRTGLHVYDWDMLDRVQPLYRRPRPPQPATDEAGN